MNEVGAVRHSPIPIGEAATPPFAIAPQLDWLFSQRADRFAVLAREHELRPYLTFLSRLCAAQHRALDGLPEPERPPAAAVARAREHAMPPLDRTSFAADPAFHATMDRLIAQCATIDMPDAARMALARLAGVDPLLRAAMARAALDDAPAFEALGEQVYVAAALQVHFARLAAGLDAARLVPVGEGACPACGASPVGSMVVGWQGAHGTRFCACSLCGALWNHVRIKCTLCGSTKGIGYEEIEDGGGAIKAETCDACGRYVKILHQHKEPALEPVADDVASLALDLLMRESGYRRGSVNPFLVGY